MALFDRIITVDIGPGGFGLFVEELRVNFQVVKTLTNEPNTASVFIYNLAPNTRSQIRELDHQVVLKAGYREDVGPLLLFRGEISAMVNSFELPDVITKLECDDGIAAIRERRDIFSFIEGTDAGQVLSEVASKFGLTLRDIPIAVKRQFLHGFSFAGTVEGALNILCDKLELEWSIQNNELQILPLRAFLTGASILVSEGSNLLGVPEPIRNIFGNLIEKQPKPGYKVKTLLNPQLEPGKTIRLSSSVAAGTYKINKVTHIGDNFTEEFYSIVETTEA